ncbi:MAG: hypothetical protein JO283_19930 [Bradyrhizobium sp.]|nr:hypothetical protein [Bradyrhizobium sp.]
MKRLAQPAVARARSTATAFALPVGRDASRAQVFSCHGRDTDRILGDDIAAADPDWQGFSQA